MPDRNQAIELKLLIEAIYLRYSYDFRDYSSASLKRRVLLALKQMRCESISELQRRILYDSQAFMELLQFLTIPVSEMFRDPSYYLALREQVMPVLQAPTRRLKIWIAGCSTGEEVYSMAIMLKEEGLLERTIIYATDINPRHPWTKLSRASFPWTACGPIPPIISRPGGRRRSPTTTPPLTITRSSTRPCVRM
jgi:chemotaxis protein methyltransferase CheR